MNLTIDASEMEAVRDALHRRKREPNADGIAHDRLRSIVERIERLEEEKTALATDIKDIYLEARCAGFDAKVLRRLIARPQEGRSRGGGGRDVAGPLSPRDRDVGP
jgi:uncharacterized protein (UPF0335 family)